MVAAAAQAQHRAMTPTDPIGAAADQQRRLRLLHKLSRDVIGLDVTFPLATGARSRRIYLDSTASTLRLQVVQDVLDRYQPYYANTHSVVHFAAELSTREYQWAHDTVLTFLHADPDAYTAFFLGSGATAGLNRVASTLSASRPDRDVVITTLMEHHSNDLPHRKHFGQVVHIPACTGTGESGCIDLVRLEQALQQHANRVNYVAVTGVSNVTGIINPIHQVAELAHRHGALVVVDGAQMVAHVPVRLSGHVDPAQDIDVFVFSGHKVYAPGAPGVVVARQALFQAIEPVEVGGGMVERVWVDRYTPTARLPDREEAGTPNIAGAIGLAAALYALDRVGMDLIFQEECRLVNDALEALTAIDDVIVYGDTDLRRCQRAGALSFNIRGLHHGLTAAILNDYFNIAVRNECFCAHPYVREMITDALLQQDDELPIEQLEALAEQQRGMVRASFGLYTTAKDIDALTSAIRQIIADRDAYPSQYSQLASGAFKHKHFAFDPADLFSASTTVDRWLDGG